MKIYLAGSITGGREFASSLKIIASILEEMEHEVITKGNVVYNQKKQNDKSTLQKRRAIVKRDKRWLKSADIFIAEVSTYSHGVGFEHCLAESLGKPTLLLRHSSLKDKKHSAFLDGHSGRKFKFSFYDEKSVESIIKRFFKGL